MQIFTEIVFWTFLQLIQLSLLSKPQQNPCKNESIPAVNRFIYLCFKSQYSEPRCPDQIGFNNVWMFNLDSQLTGQCKAISFFFSCLKMSELSVDFSQPSKFIAQSRTVATVTRYFRGMKAPTHTHTQTHTDTQTRTNKTGSENQTHFPEKEIHKHTQTTDMSLPVDTWRDETGPNALLQTSLCLSSLYFSTMDSTLVPRTKEVKEALKVHSKKVNPAKRLK